MLNKILEYIYPSTCGVCGIICKDYICSKCNIKLKTYEIKNKKDFRIKKKGKYFNELLCMFRYEDIIRDMIIKYKFQNKAYMYKTFSKIILKNEKTYGFLKKYDIIIPVPMYNKKKKERGYNQTALIAKEISKNVDNLEFKSNVLVKQKNTNTQSKLTKIERKKNILGAFKIENDNEIKNKKILLFDDIYTTGSTVNECSRILKKAGASTIAILTICKD